jgi:hypothetical protein
MRASRSHTDATTNLVVLSQLDLGRNFREIVDRDLPIHTLPTFLHEATHHWCFDTPLGLTMHLLFMRARRSALETGSDGGWDTLDNVVRYEVARDFIQPLSEGMALFAEHDAIPGEAKTISAPMSRAAGLYARGYSFDNETIPYEGLPFVLAAARVSRNHTRRKAALLLEPLSCAKGGYLPGYLLIKRLWQYARERSPLFRDSDFFLQYLREYVFDDWGLIARLLDDERKDVGVIDPIVSHITYRLRKFVEVAIEGERARRYERLSHDNAFKKLHVSTDLLVTTIRFLPIEDDDPDAELGRSVFQNALRSYFERWTGDDMRDAFLSHDLTELTQRSTVTLGTIDLQGKWSNDGLELSLSGERLATLATAYCRVSNDFDASLEVELLSLEQPGGLCFTLRHQGKLLCTVPIGTVDLAEELKGRIASRDDRSKWMTLSYELIDQALVRNDLQEHLAIIRRSLRKTLEEWLIPIALAHVEFDRLPDIQQRMRDRGLLSILGSKELLMDAAVASLAVPSPFNFDSVAGFHQWSDETPQDAIARIIACVMKELGFPPFVPDENGYFEKASFI